MPLRIAMVCLLAGLLVSCQKSHPSPSVQGGLEMVIVVDPKGEDREGIMNLDNQMEREPRAIEDLTNLVGKVAKRRLRIGGCEEASVRVQGKDRVVAVLPGIEKSETERWKSILQMVGRFELRIVATELVMDEWKGPPNAPEGFEWIPFRSPQADHPYLLCEKKSVIGNKDVVRAVAEEGGYKLGDTKGKVPWEIPFSLSDEAGKRFGDVTEKHICRRIALIIDGIVRSAPVIRSRIEREALLQGNFTKLEAETIALSLRAGAYPCRVKVESVVTMEGEKKK